MSRAVRRLRVDWPACHARGLCHELLPEVVDLDEWGYPVVTGDVPAALSAEARAAVRSCPTLALRLLPVPEDHVHRGAPPEPRVPAAPK